MRTKIYILLLSIVLSLFIASFVGKIYSSGFVEISGFGSFIADEFWYNFFDGILAAFVFSLFLLFTLFGGKNKYKWPGFLAIPALILAAYLDLRQLYVSLVLGVCAWVLGWGILKVKQSLQKDKTPIV